MPESGADPRRQLGHAKRLADVIVGAEIERLDLRALVTAGRQDDDRYRRVLAGFDDDLEAAAVGQTQIEDDQVGLVAGEHFERARRVLGGHHAMAGRSQAGPQKPQDRRLVVDDEDGVGVSHAR